MEKLRSRVAELAMQAHKRIATAERACGKPESLPACHQGAGSPVWANSASEKGSVLARYEVSAVPISGPKVSAKSLATRIWDADNCFPENR